MSILLKMNLIQIHLIKFFVHQNVIKKIIENIYQYYLKTINQDLEKFKTDHRLNN